MSGICGSHKATIFIGYASKICQFVTNEMIYNHFELSLGVIEHVSRNVIASEGTCGPVLKSIRFENSRFKL